MDGKDDPIKNDKFHIVDGVSWPAHHVNIGQFFSVSGQGLLFKEQSFGLIFQQELEPMSEQEIHQWFMLYFTRLTRITGTGVAYKDGRQALMAATQAAAPLAAAPLPAALPPAPLPSITIASMPGAQLAIGPGKVPMGPGKILHNSPGMGPGKVPIAAPMPAPAPMISPLPFPMQVGHNLFGAAASSNSISSSQAMQQRQPTSSSCSSSSQAMQQRQQLKPLPPAPPPVPPPSAMPSAGVHPSITSCLGCGATAAASPSWSSSSHVQVQSDPNQLPPHLAHLQADKDKWYAVWAARATMKKQFQQQQQ